MLKAIYNRYFFFLQPEQNGEEAAKETAKAGDDAKKRERFKASSERKDLGGHPENKTSSSCYVDCTERRLLFLPLSIDQPGFWQWKQNKRSE